VDEQKKQALKAALAQIDKQFGKGSVMFLGDEGAQADIEAVSTGSLSLDIALGIGGLPRGRVVEIYGPESSGKTTLTLHVIAEMQKLGGTAAFIDAEHALDPQYAKKLGVNTDELLISQPDTGEQALEITDMLVRSGGVDIVVVDSVAALTPKAEIEGEMGASHMGLQARLMSQALRKLTSNIKKTNTMVIFINQLRMKIGVMFGNPETTTGGNALKFYASVRLDIRRIGAIKKGDEILGNETRVKVLKNKVAPPFKQAEFQILYNEGISRESEIIDLGVKYGFVEKAGAWYSVGSERIGQGKDNARDYLKQNIELSQTIEGQIRDKLMAKDDDLNQDNGYFDWAFALVKTHLNKFIGKAFIRLMILIWKKQVHGIALAVRELDKAKTMPETISNKTSNSVKQLKGKFATNLWQKMTI
jgi:recombination protein RecA